MKPLGFDYLDDASIPEHEDACLIRNHPMIVRPDITFNFTDLLTLRETYEAIRRTRGSADTKRMREIEEATMFALLLEHHQGSRFLIGGARQGKHPEPIRIKQLLEENVGELGDWDIVLANEPTDGQVEIPHKPYQLVTYTHQRSTKPEDVYMFLKEKKFNVPPDRQLTLVMHAYQQGWWDFPRLSDLVINQKPSCPYAELFSFGKQRSDPDTWFCVKLFPAFEQIAVLEDHQIEEHLRNRKRFARDPAS